VALLTIFSPIYTSSESLQCVTNYMNFTLEIVTDERNGAACDFKNDQLQT
jgi:hypothetical protein